MIQFTRSVRQAIAEQNTYSALATALILPDICGKLETPTVTSQARYRAWWDKYMASRYMIADRSHVFLSSGDAYALRCAVLHEGADDITPQRAREVLTKFVFIHSPPHIRMHCNGYRWPDGSMGLQLDTFEYCEELCHGVDQWLVDVAANHEIQTRIGQMLVIQDYREAGTRVAYFTPK